MDLRRRRSSRFPEIWCWDMAIERLLIVTSIFVGIGFSGADAGTRGWRNLWIIERGSPRRGWERSKGRCFTATIAGTPVLGAVLCQNSQDGRIGRSGCRLGRSVTRECRGRAPTGSGDRRSKGDAIYAGDNRDPRGRSRPLHEQRSADAQHFVDRSTIAVQRYDCHRPEPRLSLSRDRAESGVPTP